MNIQPTAYAQFTENAKLNKDGSALPQSTNNHNLTKNHLLYVGVSFLY